VRKDGEKKEKQKTRTNNRKEKHTPFAENVARSDDDTCKTV
jgi:hypothetical protein